MKKKKMRHYVKTENTFYVLGRIIYSSSPKFTKVRSDITLEYIGNFYYIDSVIMKGLNSNCHIKFVKSQMEWLTKLISSFSFFNYLICKIIFFVQRLHYILLWRYEIQFNFVHKYFKHALNYFLKKLVHALHRPYKLGNKFFIPLSG
jgi:hypothetical protein